MANIFFLLILLQLSMRIRFLFLALIVTVGGLKYSFPKVNLILGDCRCILSYNINIYILCNNYDIFTGTLTISRSSPVPPTRYWTCGRPGTGSPRP